jgi:hypothetical protein
MELLSGVNRFGKVEKKCQETVNTRENAPIGISTILWLQPAARAQWIDAVRNFQCSSFLEVEVSQKCSQLIHMRFVPSSPAGLRVEIRVKIDKKKIEFYFS